MASLAILSIDAVGTVKVPARRVHAVATSSAAAVRRDRTVLLVARGLAFNVHLRAKGLPAEVTPDDLIGEIFYDAADETNLEASKEQRRVRLAGANVGTSNRASREGKHVQIGVAESKVTSSRPLTQEITVEVKLMTLSSQHEGALFRIRFSVASGGVERAYVWSDAIRVTAKRGQIKKKMERQAGTSPSTGSPGDTADEDEWEEELPKPAKRSRRGASSSASSAAVSSGTEPSSPSEIPVDESSDIIAVLEQMRSEQNEQSAVLDRLLATAGSETDPGSSSAVVNISDDPASRFTQSLQSFLESWNALPRAAKEEKLSALAADDSPGASTLHELLHAMVGALGQSAVGESAKQG